MSKLYLCIRGERVVRRCDDGSKQFRRDLTPGAIYTEEDLRRLSGVVPHCNVLVDPDAFEYLGEGPPNCDSIATVPELVEKGTELRTWIGGPVAQKLGWQLVLGSLLTPRHPTARDLVLPELRKLVDAAARLGRVAPPNANRLDETGARLVLNGILQWAAEAESKPDKVAAPFLPEAIWLGDGRVRIGDETISLEPQFADVLQALVERGAATKPQLQNASGRDEPGRLLKQLVQRFPVLKPYITLPGTRGRGGYSTTIKDGTKAER